MSFSIVCECFAANFIGSPPWQHLLQHAQLQLPGPPSALRVPAQDICESKLCGTSTRTCQAMWHFATFVYRESRALQSERNTCIAKLNILRLATKDNGSASDGICASLDLPVLWHRSEVCGRPAPPCDAACDAYLLPPGTSCRSIGGSVQS